MYVVALTMLPCSDDANSHDDTAGQQIAQFHSLSLDNNYSHDHSEGEDGCSPLCMCHCCHIHFVVTQTLAISHPEKLTFVFAEYLQHLDGIEIFDFLKPPKI